MTLGVRASTCVLGRHSSVLSTHLTKNVQALTCFINHHYFCCFMHTYIAIKNRHKLSGLKQHRFIILLFYRLEVQAIFHWAKVKETAALHLFLAVLGESPFPCPFQFPEATHIPCLLAPLFFTFKASNIACL